MRNAGQDRSNQACSIPVNALKFDHILGSPEETIGPFSYVNEVPIRGMIGYSDAAREQRHETISKGEGDGHLAVSFG